MFPDVCKGFEAQDLAQEHVDHWLAFMAGTSTPKSEERPERPVIVEMHATGWGGTARDKSGALYVWGKSGLSRQGLV